MSVAAILLTPAAHRVTVGGLALAAFAISLGLDLWQARRTAGASPDTATAQPAMGLRPATPLATPPGVALASVPANPVAGWAPAALRVSAFSCPKEGMKAVENEDGFASAPARGLAAVSDGASSSVLAREWAAALTAAFVEAAPAFTGDAIRAFLRSTADAFSAVPIDAAGGGWWSADAARQGSYATLLGFRASRCAELVGWEAAAVGDSVVVHLRSEPTGWRLVEGFPLESSAGFSGAPSLVGSGVSAEATAPAVRLVSGAGTPRDRWLLLTDEVAKWALAHDEGGRPVWALLLEGTDKQLATAVAAARASREMANDDITVLRLALA
jgi:hypothetical protein